MAKGAGPRPRVDIAALIFPVLLLLVVLGPLQRGLFFAPERDPFEVVAAVLLLAAGFHLLVRGEGPLWGHPLDWAALAFPLGYWLAYLHHPVAPASALSALLRAALMLTWFWTVAAVVRGRARVLWFCRALYASGALLAALGCLAAAGRFHFPAAAVDRRILSTIQYANAFGALLVFTLLCGLGLMQDRWSAERSARAPDRSAVHLGLLGAGNVLVVETLLGTVSRGAWLVLPVAAAVWWLGLPRGGRQRGLFFLLWPVGLALLLSRSVLDAFWGGHGAHGLAVLAVGCLAGAAGPGLYGWAVRVWERQRWTPEVRAVFRALGVLYGVGVLAFLLLASGRAAASLAGHGLVAPAVAARAASISAQTPSLVQRTVMWRDALKLVRLRPLLGYGGGGWEALYHSVQSAPYWSTQAHEALLQAWVGGGLLSMLALLGLGIGVAVYAIRARGADGTGALVWGLGAGALGLWLHSLADFDLSIPAVALLLWGAAAILRSTGAPNAPPVPGRWRWGLAGWVVTAGTALLVLVPAMRLEQAARLGGAGAVAMSQRQYAGAYTDYSGALALEPLDPTFLVDKAQLLALAAGIDHSPAVLQRGADLALAADQFAPGDLQVRAAAADVLAAAGQWPSLARDAASILREFPLDTATYDYAGPALVRAAEGELGTGSFTAAGAALRTVAGLQGTLRAAAEDRAPPRIRRLFAPPRLGVQAELAVGEADALLGDWGGAEAVLGSLVSAGNPTVTDEARVWLAVAELRAGDKSAANATFAPLSTQGRWQDEWNRVYQWTAFAPEVGPRG